MNINRSEARTIATALRIAESHYLAAPDLDSAILALTHQQQASEARTIRMYIEHKLREDKAGQ